MTTDIDTLIAEARKYGPESMSSKLIAKLADALESRQYTTREKLEWAAHAGLAPYLGSISQAIGSQEHYNKLLARVADAVLAADIFVDADKIAADAQSEVMQQVLKIASRGHVADDVWTALSNLAVNPYRAPVTAPTETEKP